MLKLHMLNIIAVCNRVCSANGTSAVNTVTSQFIRLSYFDWNIVSQGELWTDLHLTDIHWHRSGKWEVSRPI